MFPVSVGFRDLCVVGVFHRIHSLQASPRPFPQAFAAGGIMQSRQPGDIVAQRIKARTQLTGKNADALLRRYVLERTLYRLADAYGPKMMLMGSMLEMVDNPNGSRPFSDADIHMEAMEDIERMVPDLLTRTYYDSDSPTGLLEDHVRFTGFNFLPLHRSEGRGVRMKMKAMLGITSVDVSVDFHVGQDTVSDHQVKRIPPMFANLPTATVHCQPVADRAADKICAMLDFGMENIRVKDLYDIEAMVRSGRFDPKTVGRALTDRNPKGFAPACVTSTYAERHQATWESWLAESGIKDSRTLAELVREITRPVLDACREAVRIRLHEQERKDAPHLRLVHSR